jgi:hypothetical protein
MPQTIFAEAHLFLSKDRSRISLGYLRGQLELGADPFRDPELEGLEGRVSLIYAGRVSATLVVPGKQLRLAARGAAKGMVRLLLACPKPQVLLRHAEVPHFFLTKHAVRWEVRLATRPRYQFRFGEREFFVVTRFAACQRKKPLWIGVLGRNKERLSQSKGRPGSLVATS